ncbi:MAG: nuclear transport factor 2 family protein [Polyangiaceae bacterium]
MQWPGRFEGWFGGPATRTLATGPFRRPTIRARATGPFPEPTTRTLATGPFRGPARKARATGPFGTLATGIFGALAAAALATFVFGCAPASGVCPPVVSPDSHSSDALSPVAAGAEEEEKAIAKVLDDWHAAAAAADEERYFGHIADDSVFLGTDITERWDKKAFREYAHPHFAKGKAWSFHAIRRAIVIAPGGRSAWFDEDLATERLGPARGSGALVKRGGVWTITLYDLSIPIPNDRFDEVKKIIAGDSPAAAPKGN